MKIEELYDLYLKNRSVTTDSRTFLPGSIFFALRGASFNGNEFAEAALLNGCEYAVIDAAAYKLSEKTILVTDVLSTLQQLAGYHRKQLKIPVIGITGTNGKTTTKELISAVLNEKYNTLYTKGNLNNHIGVPLTLLSIKPEHEIAVIEMGANHPGEISLLSGIAAPDFGIITNIGKAHLEGFGSFEGVIKTKGELYDYIRNTGGEIFLHAEDVILRTIATDIPAILYGTEKTDVVYGEISDSSPYLSIIWYKKGVEGKNKVISNLIGTYNLSNLLAAICVGDYFDVEKEKINKAIANYEPTNNRSQLKKTDKNTLIIDAYNANPTSMHVALDNFGQMKAEKKLAIIGEMLELGKDSLKEHEQINVLLEAKKIPAILVGKEFSDIHTQYLRFADVESCIEFLQKEPFQQYTILIKGSRGVRLEKVIAWL